MTENLWGDLPDGGKIYSPYTVLKEQGSVLTKQTKGLLEGHVDKHISASSRTDPNTFTRKPVVESTLYIVVPALNSYRYSVLSVSYPVDSVYPSLVRDISGTADGNKKMNCENETELKETLRSILASPELHDIIGSLLNQVGEDA